MSCWGRGSQAQLPGQQPVLDPQGLKFHRIVLENVVQLVAFEHGVCARDVMLQFFFFAEVETRLPAGPSRSLAILDT